MDLVLHLASGVLRVEQADPAAISPGEFSGRIRDAVEASGVLILARHGMIGRTVSPVDLTYVYVSETVVVLRFFERSGRVRRALSVLEKRTGPQEDTMREFRIDGQGLRVGPPLADLRGVLTGVPGFEGDRDRLIRDRGTDDGA